MEELQLALTPARVDQKNFGLWLRSWQIGQTLDVLVAAQRPSGELVLRVAGQQITATADIPVQSGSRLLLEVRQLDPVPLLRVLQVAAPPVPTATAGVAGALQAAAAPAPATLAGTLQQLGASSLVALPPALQLALRELRALAPALGDLASAPVLRRAVDQAGIFAEARLLASGSPPPGGRDLKLLVQRALVTLQGLAPAATEADAEAAAAVALLRRELEGLLGAITLNQLASLPGDGAAARSWRMDIPFLLGAELHNARLAISEERSGHSAAGDGEERHGYRATLSLELPELGAVHVDLRLRGEQVSASFEAAEARSLAALGGGLAELADALRARGLAVEDLGARAAAAVAPLSAAATQGPGWLA